MSLFTSKFYLRIQNEEALDTSIELTKKSEKYIIINDSIFLTKNISVFFDELTISSDNNNLKNYRFFFRFRYEDDYKPIEIDAELWFEKENNEQYNRLKNKMFRLMELIHDKILNI